MNKIKKILIPILSLFFVLFMGLGVAACGKNEEMKIETLTPKIQYRVNDSIYVYDLFKWKEGQELSFSYTIDSGEENNLSGDFIYLKVEGKYLITATMTEKETKTVEIQVTNPLSRMYLENEEITVDYEASLGIKTIINRAAPFIKSEFEHREFVEKVWIYNNGNDQDPLIYDIEEGVAGAGGLFDGKKFSFNYECDYVFRIYSETSGGRVYYDLTVHCIEDLSRLKDLTTEYDFNFDRNTYVATWDAVKDASAYRVKFAGQTKIINETQIDISDYLTKDWYHFDFAVIPVKQDGEKIGKLVREDFIKAPQNSKDVILGTGVKDIDGENCSVTLKGSESYGAGYRTEIHATLNNSYIAFCNSDSGKYGVGTVAEFTFKGNNMPQVCFFADKLNGDITEYGGSGWLLMNGLYTTNKSSASSSLTNVVGEDALVLFGPNRIGDNHKNYITISELQGEHTISKNTLLTQKYLRENPNTEFRYKVRSFDIDGYLAFEAILEDDNGDLVAGPAVKVTETKTIDVKPGYIIAYATVKGDGDNTTFNYKLPYDYVDYADPNAKYFGAVFNGENSVNMSPGSHPNVSSMQGSTWGDGWISGISNYSNNYVGFENVWSVGKAVDISFLGNNMPIVTLFADSINGNMSGSLTKTSNNIDQNGYLISNGIYDVVQEPDVLYGHNQLTVFGPNRISSNLSTAVGNVSTIGGAPYSGLGENTNYKYTIATIIENNQVSIIIELYNSSTNELLNISRFETGKTKQEVEELGSGIIFYAGVKGNGLSTKFTYSEIYAYEFKGADFQMSGGVVNNDGSVTLQAGTHTKVSSMNGSIWDDGWNSGVSAYKNNYIAFKNVSEVGNYMDFIFTGNNMPIVTLFADQITQSMGADTTGDNAQLEQNGYVISNGLYDATDPTPNKIWGENKISVAGPNRISVSAGSIPEATVVIGSYNGLDEMTNYKYTIGSQLQGTEVIIVVELYNVDTTSLIYRGYYNTGKTEEQVENLGTHIIAYAGVKGNSLATTFKYSEVYDKIVNIPVSRGATVNADGSVTLAPGTHEHVSSQNGAAWSDGWASGISAFKNNYIAFEGASKVGQYIDFYFTGNNMPQVTMFAGEINTCVGGSTTADSNSIDNTGYYISNGIYESTGNRTLGEGLMFVYGENRVCDNPRPAEVTASNLDVVQGAYTGLTEGTDYKYTVGSKVVGETVVIEVMLYTVDGANETLIYSATYDTEKTVTKVEEVGSHIIAYAGIKGSNLTTTFSYTEVYEK